MDSKLFDHLSKEFVDQNYIHGFDNHRLYKDFLLHDAFKMSHDVGFP